DRAATPSCRPLHPNIDRTKSLLASARPCQPFLAKDLAATWPPWWRVFRPRARTRPPDQAARGTSERLTVIGLALISRTFIALKKESAKHLKFHTFLAITEAALQRR